MELRAGLIEGRWTPLATRQAVWAVAHLTPQECEDFFFTLGGMTPSKSSFDRLPKQLGVRWEEKRKEFERELREQQYIPERATTVAVSLDGVMVPMKDGKRAEKRAEAKSRGKETRGPMGYQEAGCGTVSFLDAQGERLLTLRLARMPEAKKTTLKSMLTEELLSVLDQRPDLELVKIADGAKDNWTFVRHLPKGPAIVDFYHAGEHHSAALGDAYGEGSTQCRSQFEKLRHVLRHDTNGVAKDIRALRRLRDRFPRREKIATEVKYFQSNRKRMRYAAVAASGGPIGSGVVEAVCRTLVSQRLKRSGMRWRIDGGQAILTFRALTQSGRFDQGWELIANEYKRPVITRGNLLHFGRRASH